MSCKTVTSVGILDALLADLLQVDAGEVEVTIRPHAVDICPDSVQVPEHIPPSLQIVHTTLSVAILERGQAFNLAIGSEPASVVVRERSSRPM